ncbi:MAG: type II toxin-antitoxin system RelE/ParE family toxin [Oscillospiraceae bacterium]|nr:type II toxin-antitoxin system RelE/ParE family toxin [Oscillospiraceae bacterium]
MAYQLDITDEAKMDMVEIYNHITTQLRNPIAAANTIARIDEAILDLAESPGYSLVNDEFLAAQGLRRIVAGNYLVFFSRNDEEKTIEIMRVLYGRRDWANILTNPQNHV